MADVKISGLPASTTPLAGTEVLPIVQGGVTKQVSVANLTAGRAIGGSTVTAATTMAVGAATPAASGAGITFPAIQSASSDANTLDDYEEGTYTATMTPSGSGSIPLNASYQTLSYTKVGRLVTVTGLLVVGTVSSPVGNISINLPFAVNSGGTQFRTTGTYMPRASVSVAISSFICYAIENATSFVVYVGNSSAESATAADQTPSSSFIYINFSYAAA